MVTSDAFSLKYLGFLKMDKNKCPKKKFKKTFPKINEVFLYIYFFKLF